MAEINNSNKVDSDQINICIVKKIHFPGSISTKNNLFSVHKTNKKILLVEKLPEKYSFLYVYVWIAHLNKLPKIIRLQKYLETVLRCKKPLINIILYFSRGKIY